MPIKRLLLIGASTGGPGRIHTIVSALDAGFDGSIIIAQHMAAPFISSFSAQLQSVSTLPVIEVDKETEIQNSHVYICKVTSHLKGDRYSLKIEPSHGEEFNFNPEIDTLFCSASSLDPGILRMGIILTGIGNDGAEGSLLLHRSGGQCYFENEESSTVYGMPRRAKELVPEGKTLSMDEIINVIKSFGGNDVRMV